jgi:hypothetical protein
VALSYALSAFAAYAILATRPDVSTRTERHLMAGALALVKQDLVFAAGWRELAILPAAIAQLIHAESFNFR